jgi:hypothetical protein
MKTINYNGKKIKMPCEVVYDDCELVTEQNSYSGEECQLPNFARGVYYKIKNAEINEDFKTMKKCISWFQKHFTKQYYVLLD